MNAAVRGVVMGKVVRLSRVRRNGLLWCVELLSTMTGQWTIAAEWSTQAEAFADLKNWR